MRARAPMVLAALALAATAVPVSAQDIRVIASDPAEGPVVITHDGGAIKAALIQRNGGVVSLIIQPARTKRAAFVRPRPREEPPPSETYAHCRGLAPGPCPNTLDASLVLAKDPDEQHRNRTVVNPLSDRGARPGISPLIPRAGRVSRPITWGNDAEAATPDL